MIQLQRDNLNEQMALKLAKARQRLNQTYYLKAAGKL